MKVLRAGVTHARDDLESLLAQPVALITAGSVQRVGDRNSRASNSSGAEPVRVAIGTTALLSGSTRWAAAPVGLVAFLDMDQELLATRYRAAEEAMAMLVGASRLLGGRQESRHGGGILVQTRRPHHPVLEAAVRADPAPLAAAETFRRELLGLPPAAPVAAVGGEAAPEWIERLGTPEGIEVQGPRDGWWLVRAASSEILADACAAVSRPPGRLALRVDPVRLP
jgi:primosomal protein N' (replication factor Y)